MAREYDPSRDLKKLRDFYKKLIVVNINIESKYYFSIYDLEEKRNSEIITTNSHKYYESYEQAEFEGMQDCYKLLKLI